MKKVIDGLLYDTDTALDIAWKMKQGFKLFELSENCEDLFITHKGNFFFYTWSDRIWLFGRETKEDIRKASFEEARQFTLEHNPDAYYDFFERNVERD